MDDEECLPENSSLNIYLQNLGYSDIQVKKQEKITSKLNTINFVEPKTKSRYQYVESIDEKIIEDIEILISTKMLFEEDVRNLENLLSNFKVVKNGMIKSMFKGVTGVAIVFLGLCLYCIIGSYAFIFISSFYAYKAADYLRKKHFNQTQLKKLATVLKSNCSLLIKTVRFVKENNKFIEDNCSSNDSDLKGFSEGFTLYKNFKAECLVLMDEMITILSKSTLKLIKKMPLYEYIENPKYYVCSSLNKGSLDAADLSKLYQIYLLVQSEFLGRLILSLIPNIKLSNDYDFQEINRVVTETYISLMKVKKKLDKKFLFIFLNGVHEGKPKMELKLPLKTKTSSINYTEEFVSNIHDTSNTFQNILIESRIIEENIKSEKIPDNIEDKLVNIQNDLQTCQKNIADSFILLKKANAVKNQINVVKVDENEVQHSNDKSDKILVGHTDLDPNVEDEIYEAHFCDEKVGLDLSELDAWDFEGSLKKKLEKEYSKKVIEELKVRLVEKAKNRRIKEAELLRKKGIEVDSEEPTEKVDVHVNNLQKPKIKTLDNLEYSNCTIHSSLNHILANEIKIESLKNSIAELHTKDSSESNLTTDLYANEIESDINSESKPSKQFCKDNVDFDIHECQSSYLGVNTKFLSDICEARKRILTSTEPVKEYFFGDSEEDLVQED